MCSSDAIEAAILARVGGRGATCCPSEVARKLDPGNWRVLMPAVREAAARLQQQGQIAVTQEGRAVAIREACGPVRLGLPQPAQTSDS